MTAPSMQAALEVITCNRRLHCAFPDCFADPTAVFVVTFVPSIFTAVGFPVTLTHSVAQSISV